LAVLGFEFRAWYLTSKCTTTWVMPPALCDLLIFSDRVLPFCLGQPQTSVSLHIPPMCLYFGDLYKLTTIPS
jgi:hypothetical protein